MVAFVVLHYKNINDTIECLDSIKKLSNQDKVRIVVVDNNSLIDSEVEMLKRYTEDIILLDDNLGFAKANNIGCNYAKEKYDPDFVCVINNDTIIYQKDFIDKIEKNYKKYKFDMLGPYIETDGGDSVNPFMVFDNITKINDEIKKTEKLIKIYDSSVLTSLLNVYMKIKYLFVKPIKLHNSLKLEKNVALHGCFLMFSRKYLRKYEFPFYNETFLYHEEEFLYFRMKRDSLISIYDPNIKIFHKEGASLDCSFDTKIRNKKKFREQMRLQSLKLLRKYLEDNYEKKS